MARLSLPMIKGKLQALAAMDTATRRKALFAEVGLPMPPMPAPKTVGQLDEGLFLLELWDETLTTPPLPRGAGEMQAALLHRVGELIDAYLDCVAEVGEDLNVCVSTENPYWVAALWAQYMGVPIYTVVGADDHRQQTLRLTKGKSVATKDWHGLLCPLLDVAEPSGDRWQIPTGRWAKALPNALLGYADEEGRMEGLATAFDTYDHLLAAVDGDTYYVAEIYRSEAEDETPMLLLLTEHPLLDPLTLYEAVNEKPIADVDTARRLLQEQSGWEPIQP